MYKILVSAALALLLGAGCESPEETEPVEVVETETVTEEPQAQEPEAESTTSAPDDRELFVLDEPVTWSDNGVELVVTEVEFAAPDAAGMDDLLMFADVEPSVIVAMTVEVSNDSGREVDFWPEYGRIHLGREQATADILVSGEVGGTLRDGVDSRGAAMFLLTDTDYETAVETGELVYVIDAALDTRTFDTVTEDAELTVSW